MGKTGEASPEAMLARAESARRGIRAAVLRRWARPSSPIPKGLEMIEAARLFKARIAVVAYTNAQREFLQSLGLEDAVEGVVSIEALKRRGGEDFDWPTSLPRLPDSKTETEAFKRGVRDYQQKHAEALRLRRRQAAALAGNPRGAPDLVIERAAVDTLGVSSSLVRPVWRPRRLRRRDGGQALHLLRPAGLDPAAAHPDADRLHPGHAFVQRP
jgi:acrylyl-CoA reductase (NADPH)/3-hydroxypropionyl-CoA dehydratase/3-hydroxypropionyl-CoA synthetase